MASAPSITSLVSDPLGKSSPKEAPQQENGDSHLPKSADDSTVTKSPEPNASDNTAAANGASSGPSETKQDQPTAGEKRELEATSTTEPSTEKTTEPDLKKQKTNDGPPATTNGSSAAAQSKRSEAGQPAPEKKKGGRPKKTKETVKKDVPTDGIGSRTRSRTKVT